jgi:hypothetical protein
MLENVDATIAQTSGLSSVFGADKLSIHVKFSAPNSGTFTVQAKNSEKDDWFEVIFNSALTITAETEALILLNEVPFESLRLLWAPSAGSGTLTAIYKMKSQGAG